MPDQSWFCVLPANLRNLWNLTLLSLKMGAKKNNNKNGGKKQPP